MLKKKEGMKARNKMQKGKKGIHYINMYSKMQVNVKNIISIGCLGDEVFLTESNAYIAATDSKIRLR